MTTSAVTLRRSLTDPGLLGGVLGDDSWRAWRVLLIAAMGETLHDDERELFTKLTGREREPMQRVEEFFGIVGRRGGKSRAISALAAHVAGLQDHSAKLVPGERGVLLCVAPDQRQASISLNYVTAAFEQSPIMRQLVAKRTADTLSLANNIDIEVRAASFRRLRGPTYIGVVADESAFFFSEDFSSNSDTEILNALRPGLSTTGGLLAVISSPHAKKGEMWESYRQHFGPNGDPLVLVAQAASRVLNPTLPQSVVDRALQRDHAAASAEYLAQFRNDLESFVNYETVQACVERGVQERPPVRGVRYISFCDPSGGSSDSMCIAVGHLESNTLVIDAVRERPAPFDPESVVAEFADFLGMYRCALTTGDRYSAEWVVSAFERRSIKYAPSEQNKSELYLEMLPRLNARSVRLLDLPSVSNQICLLERRTARGGRDSIDHPRGARDDLANCIAGLCGLTSGRKRYDSSYSWVSNGKDDPDWARISRNTYIMSGGRIRI